MRDPFTQMYAAVATATPEPVRPRGGHGFHHNDFTPDASGDSTGLLVGLGIGAVALAFAAWLFILWSQRRSRTAVSTTPGSVPDPAARASSGNHDNGPW